jgi:cytochrome P450
MKRCHESEDGRPPVRGDLPPGPAMSEREQTFAWYARPYAFLKQCADQFGDVFTLDVKGWGPTVCFARPNAIRDIFGAAPTVLQAGRANRFLEPVLGRHSLILLDGAEHVAHRRLLLPAFHGARMRLYGRVIQEIAAEAIARWPADGTVSMTESMLEISRDVILEVVFGLDRDDSRREPIRAAVGQFLAAIGTTVQCADATGASGPSPAHDRYSGAALTLDAILFEEFARRRAEPERARDDVLGTLVGARGTAGLALSDVELRDALVTLLMAGHETTALSLAWTLVELDAHPDVKARLRSELLTAGPDADPGAVAALPYLDAVCKEVLRLRPVVPAVPRWVAKDVCIDGRNLPAGVQVAACIYLTHRRSEIYPGPDEFRPERFVGVEAAPWEFLPFGGGVRRCIGMAFAMYEMKLVLAEILKRVDATGANRRPWVAVRHSVVVAPSERCWMNVHPVTATEKRELNVGDGN